MSLSSRKSLASRLNSSNFELRPVSAAAEDVQLDPRNHLERHQRTVDRLTRSSRPQINNTR